MPAWSMACLGSCFGIRQRRIQKIIRVRTHNSAPRLRSQHRSPMNITKHFRSILIGRSRSLSDKSLFHKVSLIAVLAWVGLGADGLSSSCYGPEETFKALGTHIALAPIVGLAAMATIAIICI